MRKLKLILTALAVSLMCCGNVYGHCIKPSATEPNPLAGKWIFTDEFNKIGSTLVLTFNPNGDYREEYFSKDGTSVYHWLGTYEIHKGQYALFHLTHNSNKKLSPHKYVIHYFAISKDTKGEYFICNEDGAKFYKTE